MHLQTTTNLFHNILSSFLTTLRVKGFRQSNTVILSRWRACIDHKRPIKAIEPLIILLCLFFKWSDSFRDLFYAVILSWNSFVYWNMIIDNFVYWSDGLEGWAFDHHRRNGGGAFANKNCLQGRAFEKNSQMPRGGGCLRLELTQTLILF